MITQVRVPPKEKTNKKKIIESTSTTAKEMEISRVSVPECAVAALAAVAVDS